MSAPTLLTDRLRLDGHRVDDLDALTAMWQQPSVYAMIGGQPRSREEVWRRLLGAVGQWELFGYGFWVVRERAGGPALGQVGLMEARRDIEPALDAPEVGWTLTPEVHGRGYGREALSAVLGWADAQGIARTLCIIDLANAASRRLAARVGFVAAGRRDYAGHGVDLFERFSSRAAA